jgi:predicted RNase H-like HicB family nuclease
METAFKVEFDHEEDSRWIAEVVGIPGVLAYGSSQEEAKQKAEALAQQVILERKPQRT